MQAACLYFCLSLPINLFHWVWSDSFLVIGHRRAKKTAYDKTDRPTLLTEQGFCLTLVDTSSPIFSLSYAYFSIMKISSQ